MKERYRVLVCGIGDQEIDTGYISRYLRDHGNEVIPFQSYADPEQGGAAIVRAAVQEDVDAIDITTTAAAEVRGHDAIESGLQQYDADNIGIDMHYPADGLRAAWTRLDGVGDVNGQLLADAGLDPDDATVKDVWNALQDGYTERLGDEAVGQDAGRAQAKRIIVQNRERYKGQPTPGQQSSIRWWASLDSGQPHRF